MSLNRRNLVIGGAAAVGAAAVGGTSWWLLRDTTPRGASDRIDLLAGVYRGLPYQSDPVHFAMLGITGGMPKSIRLELRLFDLAAIALPLPANMELSLANLVTGESANDIVTNSNPDGSISINQSSLRSDGWWQLVASWDGMQVSWTFLVPDPNLTGFVTPPSVATEPDAQAMLAAALNTLTQRTSLRWWEWLSGGNGSIVLAGFSVTTPESNGLPASFESDAMLGGRIPPDGTAASFREKNTRTVSIDGEGALTSVNGGTPEAANTISYLPISRYDTTYAGYEDVHFGITTEIEGRLCQLIAFHLPGQVEAWFAFWIDTETLFLRELFMLSVNHYMHWIYYDIDEAFVLNI